jgi:hypothetical protein
MITTRSTAVMLPLAWLTLGLRLLAAGARERLTPLAPHLPAAARRGSELAGFGCAAVFLHHVWSPLVWAGAAVVLVLAGQDRR